MTNTFTTQIQNKEVLISNILPQLKKNFSTTEVEFHAHREVYAEPRSEVFSLDGENIIVGKVEISYVDSKFDFTEHGLFEAYLPSKETEISFMACEAIAEHRFNSDKNLDLVDGIRWERGHRETTDTVKAGIQPPVDTITKPFPNKDYDRIVVYFYIILEEEKEDTFEPDRKGFESLMNDLRESLDELRDQLLEGDVSLEELNNLVEDYTKEVTSLLTEEEDIEEVIETEENFNLVVYEGLKEDDLFKSVEISARPVKSLLIERRFLELSVALQAFSNTADDEILTEVGLDVDKLDTEILYRDLLRAKRTGKFEMNNGKLEIVKYLLKGL